MKMKAELSGWEFAELELGYTSTVTVHLYAFLQELHVVEEGGNQGDMALMQVGGDGLSTGRAQQSHLGQSVRTHGDSL